MLTPTISTAKQTNNYTITGFSYTNPNVTITTSTAHNFVVGQQVRLSGINVNTTPTIGTSASITAVSSNTFTFNYGATTPGTYVSGGTVRLDITGNISVSKYINGVYFFGTTQGCYFYSIDGITWESGQVQNSQRMITGIDYDGTTYAICDAYGNIYTSTTLLPNSWTSRATLTATLHGIRWLGGSFNKWVVYGGLTQGTWPDTGGGIWTAPSGGTTWTSQTIGGTASTSGITSLAFDGTQTAILRSGGQLFVTSNAGSTWTGYSTNVSTAPNAIANQIEIMNNQSQTVLYNTAAAKWMAFTTNASSSNLHTSTATSPSLPWTKQIPQTFIKSTYWAASDNNGWGGGDIKNHYTYDSANQRILTYSYTGSSFSAYSYSASPVSINAYEEYYPLTSVQTTNTLPIMNYMNTSIAELVRPYSAVYTNNKWVLGQAMSGYTGASYMFVLLQ